MCLLVFTKGEWYSVALQETWGECFVDPKALHTLGMVPADFSESLSAFEIPIDSILVQ